MSKIFETIGLKKPRYSAFDLSHEKKLSCNMGELVPILLEEILPGDQFNVRTETMMRLAPMLAPIMHRVNVYVHYFYVPNRLLWNEWEDFITGGKEGTSAPAFPTMGFSNSLKTDFRLADYLGVPNFTTTTLDLQISQLPFRAYTQIWNDYYRDENLTDPINVETDFAETLKMRKRAWEKDYFTSALPWTQRGPAVSVPLESGNPYKDIATVVDAAGSPLTGGNMEANISAQMSTGGFTSNLHTLKDDIGIDINDLRTSSAIQRWLEKQARGGARYIETLLSHFGVKSSDARLQRVEYLGGGRQPIVISEVLNTTGTATAPQGDMTGHGISTGTTNQFSKKFEEHGYVMGIMSVLPKSAYQQGIPRHWLRDDKTDYYWPEFADLGEQEITNKELYVDTTDVAYSNATFGYQQRYAEYKYACSTVHGDFRTTLDFWHMGRIFATQPALNATFVESDPTTRIFASSADDVLWVQIYNSIKARRPMPYFANPSLK